MIASRIDWAIWIALAIPELAVSWFLFQPGHAQWVSVAQFGVSCVFFAFVSTKSLQRRRAAQSQRHIEA